MAVASEGSDNAEAEKVARLIKKNFEEKSGTQSLKEITEKYSDYFPAHSLHGRNWNPFKYSQWNPLHLAVYYNSLPLVNALIDLGVSSYINTTDNNGKTALHISRNPEITNRLLETERNDIDKEAKDGRGRTAVYDAIEHGRTGVLEVLIEKGANLNVQDNNDDTPLHYAVLRDNKGAVEALIGAGADVNITNEAGNKPLDLVRNTATGNEIKGLLNANVAESSAEISQEKMELTDREKFIKSLEGEGANTQCEYMEEKESFKVRISSCGRRLICHHKVECNFKHHNQTVNAEFNTFCFADNEGKCSKSAIECVLDKNVMEAKGGTGTSAGAPTNDAQPTTSGGVRD